MPVIAIGVPTVVDAATIAADTMETLVEAMSQAESRKIWVIRKSAGFCGKISADPGTDLAPA